jgi:hypothetical protein
MRKGREKEKSGRGKRRGRGKGNMEEFRRRTLQIDHGLHGWKRIKGCCEWNITKIRKFYILTTDCTDKKDGSNN